MRGGERVFVDSGAWIALALTRDGLHARARSQWDTLRGAGARLYTSIPVVLETYTFLDRNALRDVALAWQASLSAVKPLTVLTCTLQDLEASWSFCRRVDLHKLSAVDATSFAIMKRARITAAFAFDHHFAVAGFRMLG